MLGGDSNPHFSVPPPVACTVLRESTSASDTKPQGGASGWAATLQSSVIPLLLSWEATERAGPTEVGEGAGSSQTVKGSRGPEEKQDLLCQVVALSQTLY